MGVRRWTTRIGVAAMVGFLSWAGGTAIAGEAAPIKFGVNTALSGDSAAYGKPFLDCLKVMADIFNSQGGILGRKIEIIAYDDRASPDQSLQTAKKLIYSDKVDILHPGSISATAMTAIPIGKEAKIAMWEYAVAKKWLIEGEGMIFRAAFPDQLMTTGIARFAYESKKLRNVGILHLDDIYGELSRDIFSEEFKRLGGTIPAVATYTPGTRDFSSQLLSLARAKIDGLLLIVQGGAVAPALRQIKSFLPPSVVLLSSNEFYTTPNRNEAGDLANGVYYYMHPMIHQNTEPVVQYWLKVMKDRLGMTHEIFGRGIAGMLVLKEAISRAGTTEGIALMKQVHRLKNIPTPLGNFTYDPRDGEGLKSMVVLEAKGGADITKDEIIFKTTYTGPLYKERVDYRRFFGEGYQAELYKYHNVQ